MRLKMPIREQLSYIEQCSYPDFVALIGQGNTPPGGKRTVDTWFDHSAATGESRVLDLACNTGFSGRVFNDRCGAAVQGIDLSVRAIDEATRLAPRNGHCTYAVANAADLPFADATYTHVLGGSNFGFITERQLALAEALRVLDPAGYLCTSSYFYIAPPPEAVLDQVEAAIGWRPDAQRTFEFWEQFFSQSFTLEFQAIEDLQPLGRHAVLDAAEFFIHLDSPTMRKQPSVVREAACRRLQSIRLALDDHRNYQGLAVSVWRPK